MCSVNEDEDSEILLKNNDNSIDSIICRKCDNQAVIKLRNKDFYCQACFLVSTTHKFRATFGKTKVLRPSDNILVAHSGKVGSTVLLHLIKAGMHESVHKRLMFKMQILYIDDGMIKKKNPSERQKTIDNIAKHVEQFGFPIFVVSLSDSINKENNVAVKEIQNYSCTANEANDKRLIEIFDKLPDTSKIDLRRKLREKMIISAAKYLNCGKALLANHATSLAISILNNVALGRGAQLSLDVGFIDNRHKDITILRPMKDFTTNELNFYSNIYKLNDVNSDKTTLDDKKSPTSIQQLTEKFITDLDSQFTGTVSTIFRTSEKLVTAQENLSNSELVCPLCKAPMDTTSNNQTSAIKATLFSRFMSSDQANGKLESSNLNNVAEIEKTCCGECEDENCSKWKPSNLSIEEVRKCLCYGCQLIFNDQVDVESLPFFILDSTKRILQLQNMREQIEDFLL